MSFWATSDGSSAQKTVGKFEMGGGDIAPIPDGTSVLAIAEEAKNDEYQDTKFIKVKWRISKPAEYANRVIFQKVQVYEKDAGKADKAKRMLAAIASNAGGGLFSSMEQRNETMPSDMSLAQLCNRPMVLKMGVWELDDKSKSGNWVQAVSPAKAGAAAPAAPAPAPKPAPAPAAAAFDDSDIPF
jgi:hypothetical protein